MTFWDYLDRRGERMMRSPAGQWTDPRVMITFALIGLFAYAYVQDPNDAMKGALIAAFAAAYGYWIGASKGGTEQRQQTEKAIDLAQSAMDKK